MLKMLKTHLGLLVIPIVIVTAGCGSGDEKMGPETVPVSGTLYLDNKPLADAEVTFAVNEFASKAKTDSEGKFQLVLGAVVGDNKVYVTKWLGEKLDINPEEGMDEGQFEAMSGAGGAAQQAPKQIIPEKFSDPAKTEITYPVPEGGTESADIRLSSK